MFAGHLWTLIFIRALTGLAQAPVYSSIHSLMGQWAPQDERSIMVSVAWAGSLVGTTVSLPAAGRMVEGDAKTNPLTGGWQAVFYLFGLLGIIWAFLWFFLAASSPETHPFIGAQEKAYIMQARGGGARGGGAAGEPTSPAVQMVPLGKATAPPRASVLSPTVAGYAGTAQQPPILAVVTHPAVIAIAVAHTSHNWLWYMVLTWMPEFLRSELGFDLKAAGAVSMLPYIACTLLSVAGGAAADRLVSKGVPKLHVRKAAQTVGELLPAALLVACGYASSPTAAVVLLTLAVGINGIANAGFGSNHLDVAPQYAGLLFGLANTLASLPGLIAPVVVGYLVSAAKDRAQAAQIAQSTDALPHVGPMPQAVATVTAIAGWRQVFWLTAGVALAGWAVYMRLARTDPILSFERESLLRRFQLGSKTVTSPPRSHCDSGADEESVGIAPVGFKLQLPSQEPASPSSCSEPTVGKPVRLDASVGSNAGGKASGTNSAR
jgi:MFS family permease